MKSQQPQNFLRDIRMAPLDNHQTATSYSSRHDDYHQTTPKTIAFEQDAKEKMDKPKPCQDDSSGDRRRPDPDSSLSSVPSMSRTSHNPPSDPNLHGDNDREGGSEGGLKRNTRIDQVQKADPTAWVSRWLGSELNEGHDENCKDVEQEKHSLGKTMESSLRAEAVSMDDGQENSKDKEQEKHSLSMSSDKNKKPLLDIKPKPADDENKYCPQRRQSLHTFDDMQEKEEHKLTTPSNVQPVMAHNKNSKHKEFAEKSDNHLAEETEKDKGEKEASFVPQLLSSIMDNLVEQFLKKVKAQFTIFWKKSAEGEVTEKMRAELQEKMGHLYEMNECLFEEALKEAISKLHETPGVTWNSIMDVLAPVKGDILPETIQASKELQMEKKQSALQKIGSLLQRKALTSQHLMFVYQNYRQPPLDHIPNKHHNQFRNWNVSDFSKISEVQNKIMEDSIQENLTGSETPSIDLILHMGELTSMLQQSSRLPVEHSFYDFLSTGGSLQLLSKDGSSKSKSFITLASHSHFQHQEEHSIDGQMVSKEEGKDLETKISEKDSDTKIFEDDAVGKVVTDDLKQSVSSDSPAIEISTVPEFDAVLLPVHENDIIEKAEIEGLEKSSGKKKLETEGSSDLPLPAPPTHKAKGRKRRNKRPRQRRSHGKKEKHEPASAEACEAEPVFTQTDNSVMDRGGTSMMKTFGEATSESDILWVDRKAETSQQGVFSGRMQDSGAAMSDNSSARSSTAKRWKTNKKRNHPSWKKGCLTRKWEEIHMTKHLKVVHPGMLGFQMYTVFSFPSLPMELRALDLAIHNKLMQREPVCLGLPFGFPWEEERVDIGCVLVSVKTASSTAGGDNKGNSHAGSGSNSGRQLQNGGSRNQGWGGARPKSGSGGVGDGGNGRDDDDDNSQRRHPPSDYLDDRDVTEPKRKGQTTSPPPNYKRHRKKQHGTLSNEQMCHSLGQAGLGIQMLQQSSGAGELDCCVKLCLHDTGTIMSPTEEDLMCCSCAMLQTLLCHFASAAHNSSCHLCLQLFTLVHFHLLRCWAEDTQVNDEDLSVNVCHKMQMAGLFEDAAATAPVAKEWLKVQKYLSAALAPILLVDTQVVEDIQEKETEEHEAESEDEPFPADTNNSSSSTILHELHGHDSVPLSRTLIGFPSSLGMTLPASSAPTGIATSAAASTVMTSGGMISTSATAFGVNATAGYSTAALMPKATLSRRPSRKSMIKPIPEEPASLPPSSLPALPGNLVATIPLLTSPSASSEGDDIMKYILEFDSKHHPEQTGRKPSYSSDPYETQRIYGVRDGVYQSMPEIRMPPLNIYEEPLLSVEMKPKGQPGVGEVVYGTRQLLLTVARRWRQERDQCRTTGRCRYQHHEEGVILPDFKKKLRILHTRYQKHHQWERLVHLGNGVTGKCHLCIDRTSNFKFCCKKMHILSYEDQELDIWSDLSHCNIVSFFGALRHGEKIYMFCEFIDGGSLASLIKEQWAVGRRLSHWMALNYFRQILETLTYLKAMGILHEDIKADNLLLRQGTTEIILADFGVAQRICHDHAPRGKSPTGSPAHWAPEKASCDGHGFPSDLWAAACVLIHLLSGSPPWIIRFPDAAILNYIIWSKPAPVEDIPENVKQNVRDLISCCLVKDAAIRPTAKQILQHQAFQLLNQSGSLYSTLLPPLPGQEGGAMATVGISQHFTSRSKEEGAAGGRTSEVTSTSDVSVITSITSVRIQESPVCSVYCSTSSQSVTSSMQQTQATSSQQSSSNIRSASKQQVSQSQSTSRRRRDMSGHGARLTSEPASQLVTSNLAGHAVMARGIPQRHSSGSAPAGLQDHSPEASAQSGASAPSAHACSPSAGHVSKTVMTVTTSREEAVVQHGGATNTKTARQVNTVGKITTSPPSHADDAEQAFQQEGSGLLPHGGFSSGLSDAPMPSQELVAPIFSQHTIPVASQNSYTTSTSGTFSTNGRSPTSSGTSVKQVEMTAKMSATVGTHPVQGPRSLGVLHQQQSSEPGAGGGQVVEDKSNSSQAASILPTPEGAQPEAWEQQEASVAAQWTASCVSNMVPESAGQHITRITLLKSEGPRNLISIPQSISSHGGPEIKKDVDLSYEDFQVASRRVGLSMIPEEKEGESCNTSVLGSSVESAELHAWWYLHDPIDVELGDEGDLTQWFPEHSQMRPVLQLYSPETAPVFDRAATDKGQLFSPASLPKLEELLQTVSISDSAGTLQFARNISSGEVIISSGQVHHLTDPSRDTEEMNQQPTDASSQHGHDGPDFPDPAQDSKPSKAARFVSDDEQISSGDLFGSGPERNKDFLTVEEHRHQVTANNDGCPDLAVGEHLSPPSGSVGSISPGLSRKHPNLHLNVTKSPSCPAPHQRSMSEMRTQDEAKAGNPRKLSTHSNPSGFPDSGYSTYTRPWNSQSGTEGDFVWGKQSDPAPLDTSPLSAPPSAKSRSSPQPGSGSSTPYTTYDKQEQEMHTLLLDTMNNFPELRSELEPVVPSEQSIPPHYLSLHMNPTESIPNPEETSMLYELQDSIRLEHGHLLQFLNHQGEILFDMRVRPCNKIWGELVRSFRSKIHNHGFRHFTLMHTDSSTPVDYFVPVEQSLQSVKVIEVSDDSFDQCWCESHLIHDS